MGSAEEIQEESLSTSSFSEMFSEIRTSNSDVSQARENRQERESLVKIMFPRQSELSHSMEPPTPKKQKAVDKWPLTPLRRSGRVNSQISSARKLAAVQPLDEANASSASSSSTDAKITSNSITQPLTDAKITSNFINQPLNGVNPSPEKTSKANPSPAKTSKASTSGNPCRSSVYSVATALVSTCYNSDSDDQDERETVIYDTTDLHNSFNATFTYDDDQEDITVSHAEENNTEEVNHSPNISFSSVLSNIGGVNNEVRTSDVSEEAGEDSDKENIEPEPKKRRKAQKCVKKFGQRITEQNAMPVLSDGLKNELRHGIIDRLALNREVQLHLKRIRPDLYLTTNQWHMVCSRLIAEYPILADADNPLCYDDLKYKLRNSISSKRSYKLNGVPKRNQSRPAEHQVEDQADQASSDELTRQSTIRQKALQDLKDLKGNTENLKELVKITLDERRESLKENGPTELLLTYPHYRNADLLIYEYSLIVEFDLNTLHENADNFVEKLLKLDDHFSPSLDSNLMTICNVQKELIPKRLKNKKLKGAIICKDAAAVHMDFEALSTGHAEHAPFILVIVDTNQQGRRVISRAFLLYDKGVMSQFDNPSISDLMLYLLAAYFVLDREYPLYYNSFLRLLEKNVHGELSFATSSTRAKQEYNNFLKTKFNFL